MDLQAAGERRGDQLSRQKMLRLELKDAGLGESGGKNHQSQAVQRMCRKRRRAVCRLPPGLCPPWNGGQGERSRLHMLMFLCMSQNSL